MSEPETRALNFGREVGSAPLDVWTGRVEPHARAGVEMFALEFASRGDRVPARVLLPKGANGPVPVVIAQHGLGGHKAAPYMEAAVAPWAERGVAVATIDFPLHGERASAKLSERISDLEALDAGLWLDLAEQAVIDLRHLLHALDGDPRVTTDSAVYAGFSLGGILGCLFCAEEPRIRAAAFAISGAGVGPAAADPAAFVGRIAPRPVHFVQAEHDTVIPRAAALALHEAAAAPKTVEWFDSGHSELPGAALKSMWRFLEPHLRAG